MHKPQYLQPCGERRAAALAAAIQDDKLIDDECPSLILMDLDALDAVALHIAGGAGYPDGTLHTVAVKANPTGGVLRRLCAAGLGAEVCLCCRVPALYAVVALLLLHQLLPPQSSTSESSCPRHLQAASLGELRQALHVGFAPRDIVFDSPAKTCSELRCGALQRPRPHGYHQLSSAQLACSCGSSSIVSFQLLSNFFTSINHPDQSA